MIGRDVALSARRLRGSDAAALWPSVIVAASALGSLAFACVTPFAGLAAFAAATMPLRRALGTVAMVWIVNQAIGYSLLHYPWTLDTVLWGVFIGAAALAATVAASFAGRAGHLGGALAALVASLVVFHAGLFAISVPMGGVDDYTPAILGQTAIIEALWFAGLLAVYRLARMNLSLRAAG